MIAIFFKVLWHIFILIFVMGIIFQLDEIKKELEDESDNS